MIQISDSTQKISSFKPGDVIEFMPTKVYGNTINIDDDSFLRKIDDLNEIVSLSDLRTKISDVKVGTNYCIEAIVIKEPERREVQTKTGEMISLSEMFIEDDSKQIWLKGWREQASLIAECSIGEIFSVTGVTAKEGLEGRIELFLTPFSTITRKN